MLRLHPRVLWLFLLPVALLTASCQPISPNLADRAAPVLEQAPTAPSFGNSVSLSGQVTFPTGEALPRGASLQIEVVDPEGGFYPANVLARTTMEASGLRSPIPYVVALERTAIAPGRTLLLGARVLSGDEVLLSSQSAVDVSNASAGLARVEVVADPLPDDPATPGVFAGTVDYRARVRLPEGAQVIVDLVDRTASPFASVGRQIFITDGSQPPLDFAVAYDPAAIDPRRTYALDGRIVIENKVAFLLGEPIQVLTLGKAKDQVELVLDVADEDLVDRLTAAALESGGLEVLVDFAREIPLPDTAVIQLEIVDPNSADAATAVVALAEQSVSGLAPLGVEMLLEEPIDLSAAYELIGRILLDGEAAFEVSGIPVLTQGAPTEEVELTMQAVGAERDRQRELARAGLTGVLTGDLAYDERIALAPQAVASIVLIEATPGADLALAPVVASTDFATNGLQPPLAFFLDYDPEQIDFDKQYLLEAALLADGEVLWVSREPLAVLTPGEPFNGVTLELAQAAQASDAASRFVAAAVAAESALESGVVEDGSLTAIPDLVVISGSDGAGPRPTFDHIVQSGETLSAIAARYGVTVDDLREVNNLEDDFIYAGAPLKVPDLEAEAAAGDVQGADAESADEAPAQVMTGTVGYRARIALPPGSLVEVQLIDVTSDPPLVVAQDVITTAGEQVPIGFTLTFTPTAADDGRSYGLAGRITVEGTPRFVSSELTPAKQAGVWRTGVDLLLAPTDWASGAATPTPAPAPTPVATLAPTPEPAASSPAAITAESVTGEVVLAESLITPEGAVVTVQLRDVSTVGGDTPVLAEQTFVIGTDAPPFAFDLAFDPDEVDPAGRYVVSVRVTEGDQVLAMSGRGIPVLTNGAPTEVTVNVGP
jgi:putative lipoprotein